MGAKGLTFSHGADGCGFSVVRPQCNSAHGDVSPLQPRSTTAQARTARFGARFAPNATEPIRIIKTPIRAPRANAIAERFVGTVRRECLDRFLILGRRHLEVVLAEHVDHHNRHRPHRSLQQRCPSGVTSTNIPITNPDPACIRRTDVLAGLIHEYRLAA